MQIELSARVFNALKREGITTLAQLTTLTYEELWDIRWIGEKSITEITDALAQQGLELRSEKAGIVVKR